MKYIGVNGVPTPAEQAVIPVTDHGLLYGMGLFETFRTYQGVPFLLGRHMERLRTGCSDLGIQFTRSEAEIRAEIAELLELNGLSDGYVRYTVTAGVQPLGLPEGDYTDPATIMFVKELPQFPESLYREGRALQLLSTRRNTPEGRIRHKSLHYMNNILARRELSNEDAIREGCSLPVEGCMLTQEEYLSEGIVSNLFMVKEGCLHTPAVGTGILPGITREVVMEIAGSLGILVKEGLYTWGELEQADEVFLTSSIQELVPVTLLLAPGRNLQQISLGEIGPVTHRLLSLYRKLARGIRA